jgi:hypothetical protein
MTLPKIVVTNENKFSNQTYKHLIIRPKSAEPVRKIIHPGEFFERFSDPWTGIFPVDVHARALQCRPSSAGRSERTRKHRENPDLNQRSSSLISLNSGRNQVCSSCGKSYLSKSSSSEGINGQDLASYFTYRVAHRRSTEDLASRSRLQKPLSLQRSELYRTCGCYTRDHLMNSWPYLSLVRN